MEKGVVGESAEAGGREVEVEVETVDITAVLARRYFLFSCPVSSTAMNAL